MGVNHSSIIKLLDLFETNNYIKLNPTLYINWLKFIHIIPIGHNYDIGMYTDIHGYRIREPLFIRSKNGKFYKGELPIYEHLKIENLDKNN